MKLTFIMNVRNFKHMIIYSIIITMIIILKPE